MMSSTQIIQGRTVRSVCDLIDLLRSAFEIAIQNKETSDPIANVRDVLVESLQTAPPGITLMMLFRFCWWDSGDESDRHTELQVRYQSEVFPNVQAAEGRQLSRRVRREPMILEPHEFTPFEVLVINNNPAFSGDINSPKSLIDAIDEVASLCGQFDSDHQVAFLDALEASVRRAERAGATVAAVQIFDHAGGRVSFESFICDSEVHFATEEARRRTSGKCVKIRVLHRDRN